MSKVDNLVINGSGSYGGGSYEKVSIRGEGTIVHDLECMVLNIYGSSRIKENVKASAVKVVGEAEIKGNADIKEASVMGTLEIGGQARIEKLKIKGSLEVGNSLHGEIAHIRGSLSVTGNVEFETFDSSGGFDIKGLLSADAIKVVLNYGENTVEEIGGGKIMIKRGAWLIPFTSIPLSKKAGFLTAKVIEGDEIYLENTEAEVVRGNKVQLGPGCQVGLVEYSTDFIQDRDAAVKASNKI